MLDAISVKLRFAREHSRIKASDRPRKNAEDDPAYLLQS